MTKKKLSLNETSFNIQEVIGWKPPVLHQASECYVSFSAFDPNVGKMRMKKIMLDHIKGKRQQRMYGMELIKRLTQKLLEGWNPWIEASQPEEYAKFEEVSKKYETYLNRLVKEGGLKPCSRDNYLGKISFLSKWIKEKDIKLIYIYQFNKNIISQFLDYILVERNNSLRTRNNYIIWLKSFSSYLMERGYITNNPTLGIEISRKVGPKHREVIPDKTLLQIKSYLEKENKHYLLSCYMLHYLFIRPHEMAFLKIADISEKKKTVTLRGTYTKNGHDAVITIPNHVMDLMRDLKIFSYPKNFYLFSKKFVPGTAQIPIPQFAKFWKRNVKKALGLKVSYKFYSLKDTGITNMIKAKTDLLSVRDQARHSSVEVTNIYTPQECLEANAALIGYEGVF